MIPQSITIELDPDSPGSSGMLSGLHFLAPPCRRMRSIELSVLWKTEGYGEEDSVMHHFDQLEAKSESPHFDSDKPRRFSVSLMDGPHSYDGALIKLKWFVRVRMVEEDGTEWMGEQPFQVGNTAPAAAAATE